MIRRINLLPEDIRTVYKGRFYLFALITLSLFVGVLTEIHYYRQKEMDRLFTAKAALQKEIAFLKSEEVAYKKVIEKVNLTEARKKEIEGKAELVANLSGLVPPWADALYELSNIVPGGVWLSTLSSFDTVAGDKKVKGLKVSGMAFSNGLIADLIAAVNTSPYFEGAAMIYAQSVDYQGKEAFSFEVTFRHRKRQ